MAPTCDLRTTFDLLASPDPNVALAAALQNEELLAQPLLLFHNVGVLFRHGRQDEAVFWFYAAQLRVRYQLAFEAGDVAQLFSSMMAVYGEFINNYAFHDVENLDRTLGRVLEWDRTAANPFRDTRGAHDEDGVEEKIEAVYAGFRDLRARILADKAELEAEARRTAPDMGYNYAEFYPPRPDGAPVPLGEESAFAVAMVEARVGKCLADQPAMKEDLEAAFASWKQRNQRNVDALEERADRESQRSQAAGLFESDGPFDVAQCVALVQRLRSTDSDVDVHLARMKQ